MIASNQSGPQYRQLGIKFKKNNRMGDYFVMNVRAYGCKPYRIVAVHGGPGALGGLAGLAGDIESMTGCGVIEPMQTLSQ